MNCPDCHKPIPENRLTCESCGRPVFDDPRIEVSSPQRVPNPKPRVSISKADRNTEIGLELVSLLNTVTDDGRISVEEVAGLQVWLQENRHVDMPAIAFLAFTVEHIISDGIVTEEERTELYAAIEKVLPPDLRKYAVAKRRLADAEVRQLIKDQRAAERERDAPVRWFDFMVAGVGHQGRAEVVRRLVSEEMPVYFLRHRDNRFSSNAIGIHLPSGEQVGYVPEAEAQELAAYLDAGFKARAQVKKLLTRTQAPYPLPVVAGEIYREEAQVSTALTQAETIEIGTSLRSAASDWREAFRKAEATPQHRPEPAKQQSGLETCLSFAIVLVSVFALIFALVKC